MDRIQWLQEKRGLAEQRYDTLHAAHYDEQWGHVNQTHRTMLDHFLRLCAAPGTILDAACGAGKYWPPLIDEDWAIRGIDQSQQMLLKAREKFPSIPTERMGLQELPYTNLFEGIICIDAMEFVSPEDWPPVLNNFRRALKAHGNLYFTVELADPAAIRQAYEAGKAQGLPVVEGEWAHEGSYHYYPLIEQVRAWTLAARFNIIEEAVGDDYHHFIVRRAEPAGRYDNTSG